MFSSFGIRCLVFTNIYDDYFALHEPEHRKLTLVKNLIRYTVATFYLFIKQYNFEQLIYLTTMLNIHIAYTMYIKSNNLHTVVSFYSTRKHLGMKGNYMCIFT